MADEVPLLPGLLAHARRSAIEPGSTAPILSKEAIVQGLRLHYVDWLGLTERTVVFIHGGGLTARTWDLVCLALRDRYRCVAVDLRGHGDSEWPSDRDYRLETFAEDVALLAEREGLRDAVFVGNSLGGQVALHCAAGRLSPSGLVLVDVGPSPNLAGTQRIIDAIQRPQEFERLEDAVERAMAINPRREPAVLRESLLHNLRQQPNGRWTWKYDSGAFDEMTMEVRREHARVLWDAVTRVSCPTLVVRGAESDLLTSEQAEELCARLPDCEWTVVANAGHTVQGDNPAGLVACLEEFLPRCFDADS